MKIKNGTKKEKIITVIGANYFEHIVLDLLSKTFEIYKKRDFKRKHFQVSLLENTYATAGIVLTVLGIEAYRNRIFYLEKQKIGKNAISDLIKIIRDRKVNFPETNFQEILNEVFLLRDVIAHNHIYEVEVFFSEEWEMLGHKQKLLEGYGDRKRFSGHVVEKTRKTKALNFNVQPAKIGFEDLYTLLAIFDLFVGLCQRVLGSGYVPFHFSYKLNDYFEHNLAILMAYYYEQIPNQKYKDKFNKIVRALYHTYSEFLAQDIDIICGEKHLSFDRKYAVTNFCPDCFTFGLHKPKNIIRCNKCKFEIKPRFIN